MVIIYPYIDTEIRGFLTDRVIGAADKHANNGARKCSYKAARRWPSTHSSRRHDLPIKRRRVFSQSVAQLLVRPFVPFFFLRHCGSAAIASWHTYSACSGHDPHGRARVSRAPGSPSTAHELGGMKARRFFQVAASTPRCLPACTKKTVA